MAKAAGETSITFLALFLFLFVQFFASDANLLNQKAAPGGREVSRDCGRYVVVFDAGKISTDVHVFRFDERANLLEINGGLEVYHNVIY